MSPKLTHIALALSTLAAPAFGQAIELPNGCAAFLTVQSKQCAVSVYWRCEAGPEGHTYEASYDGDGPVSIALYDADFQWLDRQYVTTATREYLTDSKDPASMSELLETGHDAYDFVIREEGPDATVDVRHVGFDELSGVTEVIDGVELLETLFASTATNVETGEEIYSVVGKQYIMAEERLFFLGADTFSQDGRQITADGGPIRFYRPGDVGFGITTPQFECNAPTDTSWRP